MSIDLITLALATPKEVDLTRFMDDNAVTSNDVVLLATMESLQSGGNLIRAQDSFPGLRKALSAGGEFVLRMNNDGLVMKSSAFIATYNGVAMQCAFSGVLYQNIANVVINLSVIFTFNADDITSDVVGIWVQAKPI